MKCGFIYNISNKGRELNRIIDNFWYFMVFVFVFFYIDSIKILRDFIVKGIVNL